MFIQDFDKLRFVDDYVFCHVLTENPELCKRVAEIAIGRKIEHIVIRHDQKPIKETVNGKGVRFDVVFADEKDSIYDIEMQQTDQKNLPKRTRYYQSMIDLETLRQGKKYNEISDGYIIFICTFDPFKKGLHKYVARTMIEDCSECDFNDGMTKIFLNSRYKEDSSRLTEDIKEFLDYVRLGIIYPGLTEEIDKAKEKILNNEERREEYMTLLEHFEISREEGFAQGKEEGFAQGKEEGLVQGKTQARTEIIKKLSQKGYTRNQIAEMLDISIEEM